MNLTDHSPDLPEQSFRWYGPADPVPLSFIRQAGATSVFTALHQIPYGQAWPLEAILERKKTLESAGLRWSAVESVPVHEDIKTGRGDLKQLFENYAVSLRNLAKAGIHTVIYNFMPVLDWIRTDMRHVLPDGSECLRYDPAQFSAFEIHALKRPGASADYTTDQIDRGSRWWNSLDTATQTVFVQSIVDVFPGVKLGLGLDDIRAMLANYSHLRPGDLENNLARFHEAVVPVAEEVGVNLAIHPDDPPFPVLGLPRIVSTAPQVRSMLARVDSPANGLCFCTGSFSANPSNVFGLNPPPSTPVPIGSVVKIFPSSLPSITVTFGDEWLITYTFSLAGSKKMPSGRPCGICPRQWKMSFFEVREQSARAGGPCHD